MTGWAVAALALYIGWAGAAFGIRAVLQRRRTGDTGFRGISGRPGTAAWWAGALFVLALLGGAAAPLGTLTGLPELPGTHAAPVRWAGLILTLAGIGVTWVAQTNMGASWRVGVDAAEHSATPVGGYGLRVSGLPEHSGKLCRRMSGHVHVGGGVVGIE
ncbi:hypothetical protein ACWDWU_01865 [Streptomyces sp. NPDC003442]